MRKLSIGARILIAAITVVLLSSALSSYLAFGKLEEIYAPAMESKASTVGKSVNALISKLLSYGVPFERLHGLDKELSQILEDHPEISYITVRDPSGEPLYVGKRTTAKTNEAKKTEMRSREIVLPVVVDGNRLGTLHVGQNKAFIANQLRSILYDIITVVIVAILMAIEMLLFLTTFTITAPIQSLTTLMQRVSHGDLTVGRPSRSGDEVDRFSTRLNLVVDQINTTYHSLADKCRVVCNGPLSTGKCHAAEGLAKLRSVFRFREASAADLTEQRLSFVRPPLFLLIFSESMSLSFFPLYVDSLYTPIAGIPKDFIIGLPISLFMLIWALSLPPAGQWSDAHGRRRAFMLGAGITAAGLILTGFADGMLQLLVYRCLTAIGYGLVFITAQGYVTDNTTEQNRAKGMATFLSGFFSGSLCGAAIGGILAARIGYQQTFLLSSLLSLASALFVYQFIKEKPRENVGTLRKLRLLDLKNLLTNPRFLAITFLSAIPAKVCLTGFLYYTGPLYLKFLGNDSSAAGRILMAYGLAIILISPLSARMVDRFGRRLHFVVVGGFLSGVSLLVLYFDQSLFGMLAAVCLLGLAHAIGISPQLSMISALPQKPEKAVPFGATIGIFRLVERLGNVGGPMIAAIWITLFGYPGTFLIFGAYMIGSTLLLLLLLICFQRSEERAELMNMQESEA